MTPVIKEEQMTTLERKIQNFSRILASRPGDELTVLALAEASFRRGLKLEALTAYQEIGSRAVPEAHLAVAEIYSEQGMPNEAYGELRRLFQLDPENVEARLLIHALQAEAFPPEDLREVMETPISEGAIEEARLRLKIQRAIHNRELQERTRNVTLEPGTVLHEYHMEEAKKKLIRVDELLRELDRFREHNATLAAGPPRPEAVSAQAEFVAENEPLESVPLEVSAELEISVTVEEEAPESSLTEEAPGIDELPVEVLEEVTEPAFESAAELPNEDLAVTLSVGSSEPLEDFSQPQLLELSAPAEEQALQLEPEPELEPTRVPDFGSGEFALSVESPVDPDLPEVSEEDFAAAPAASGMVDLEPIDMNSGMSDVLSMDFPQPTFRDAPEPPDLDPVSSVMPIVDDTTMLMSPSEPEAVAIPEAIESAEPEQSPAVVEVEPGPASVELDAPLELSAARKSFYQTHSESLSALTTTLARTRGVTSIFLVAREGVTIDAVAKDEISEERVGELVRESFEFLEAFAKDPAYWVLECAGGIFVMQKLDDRHVLIAIGQAGANFGALRYTMDKTRTKFEQLLSQVPE